MQYILSEAEFNRGCQLSKSWVITGLDYDTALKKEEELNKQGFFTHLYTEDEEDANKYTITVFQRIK